MGEVGKWDAALFDEYRSLPPGPKKRRIASELIRINEPLIRVIVAQLCGRGEPNPKRKTAAARMGGIAGLGAIPVDDAMQCGRVAFMKLLDSFDPSKGRISYYLAMKARYELQWCEAFTQHLARAPMDKPDQRPGVGLVGMPAGDAERLTAAEHGYVNGRTELADMLESGNVMGGDRLSAVRSGFDWGSALDEMTEEDVAEWESGRWSDSVETWREEKARRAAARVYSLPTTPINILTGWEAFLKRCAFVPSGRVEVFDAWNVYALECRERGEKELPRRQFLTAVAAKGAREMVTHLRNRRSIRAIAGLRVAS